MSTGVKEEVVGGVKAEEGVVEEGEGEIGVDIDGM